MSRIAQKLESFVAQYLATKRRLPTKREIELAMSEPFQFSTQPMLPKTGATSDHTYLHSTLNGLLKDTTDIVALLREFDDDIDQLRFDFRKEQEEISSKSAEVNDYLQALSDIEEAISMVYAGLPAEAGCSNNVTVSKSGISLEQSLSEIENWTVEAAPLSANSTVVVQRITDPGALVEGRAFNANVRSKDALWTGVELFFRFPPEENSALQSIRAMRIAGTPCMMSFAYSDEQAENWTWNDPITFDGDLEYFVNISTSSLRIRFWSPGTEFAFNLKALTFVTGTYESKGVYYSMPILLKPGQEVDSDTLPPGKYALDIRHYVPKDTEVANSYALLTQAQLESYFYSDLGGTDLNHTNITYREFVGNRITVPVSLTEPVTEIPTASPFGISANPFGIKLTSKTDAWFLIQDSTVRRVWQTHLVVNETGEVELGSYADYFVIKRSTGTGQALYNGVGVHTLTPGIYKVTCNVPNEEEAFSTPAGVAEAGLTILSIDTIHREVLPLPLTQVSNQNVYNSIDTYSIDSAGLHFQYNDTLEYELTYNLPFTDSTTHHVALVLKSSMDTSDPGQTPTIRRVRLMATDEILI